MGTALLGMVLAVAALCATAVFGASLTRLISSPALYGVPFQAEFTNESTGSGSAITGSVLASLRNDHAIERITLASPRCDRRERPPGPFARGRPRSAVLR